MFWPHGQPTVRADPVDGRLFGIERAEIVDRPVGPDDLHAPDVAHLHRQQDRGQTSGWFILWRHRQYEQISPLKLRTARLVAVRRLPTPAFGLRLAPDCPNDPALDGIG